MNSRCLPLVVLDRLEIKNSTRRKSIGIKVGIDGIRVLKPSYVSKSEVMALLQEKQEWLLEKLALQQKRLDEKPRHHYGDGDSFFFLGQNWVLHINVAAQNQVTQDGQRLVVSLAARGRRPIVERVRDLLAQWFMAQALSYLSAKSLSYATLVGREVLSVKVKLTRSKWGHCSRQGELQYNWLIGFAPLPIIDYLVAHEVSHLVHMNHSAAFWAQVEVFCPNYVTARRWLKSNGHSLAM